MPRSTRSDESNAGAGVRLDTWLWAARFFRTRSLARQAIEAGRVEAEGSAGKPSHQVRVGERLRVTRGDECFGIEVLALTPRRGSAVQAQMLYRESEESRASREALLAQRRAERAGFTPPSKRPDKRARRLIRALGDIDSL